MIADQPVSSRLADAQTPEKRATALHLLLKSDLSRRTTMRLTRMTLAALPLLCALTLTGCGSDEGGGADVASAGGTSSAAADGGGEELSRDEMNMKFAQCMRENGVDMPDPEPGKGVQLKVGPETSQETVQAAMEACREYSPQENGGGKGNPEQEAAFREYAQCMRDNGVEAFPDPDPSNPGMMKITPEIGEDPDFQTAQQACQEKLAPAGGQ
jgi:predicted small secreted protein